VTPERRRLAALLSLLVVGVVVVTTLIIASERGNDDPSTGGASASSTQTPGTATPVPPSATPKVVESLGVKVTGNFGDKPKLTIPDKKPPADLRVEILEKGSGPEVTAGQSLVVNYLGQTWPTKGKSKVFDNSYDQKAPAAFTIGVGGVIQGWDSSLVGQQLGTRLLVSIPQKLAYGDKTSEDNPAAGHTLLFVVDLISAYSQDVSAHGEVLNPSGTGLPQIQNQSDAMPVIKSVKGSSPDGDKPRSALLIRGDGAKLDPNKFVVFQFTEVDAASGDSHGSTWDTGGPKVTLASRLLEGTPALKDQTVGSRAVVVTAAKGKTSKPAVVVVDIIDQLDAEVLGDVG
jgi:hypothetical protein